ncbi:MAG TPA: hypothetical protein VFW98_07925 [Gemmatimonadaceae bacterium]|nr:hypothetical protein [Gemmatimonadaceae bacterium]
MSERNHILREGVIAGLIGATSVAIWFLAIDILIHSPLYTPRVLGHALWSVFGPVKEGTAVFVAAYTVFHYIAFIVVGIIAAIIVHSARRHPSVMAGFLLVFVIIEMGFYGITSMLDTFLPLGALAWYQVAIGNLIAAVLMGYYFYRAHPTLTRELQHALEGRDDDDGV